MAFLYGLQIVDDSTGNSVVALLVGQCASYVSLKSCCQKASTNALRQGTRLENPETHHLCQSLRALACGLLYNLHYCLHFALMNALSCVTNGTLVVSK